MQIILLALVVGFLLGLVGMAVVSYNAYDRMQQRALRAEASLACRDTELIHTQSQLRASQERATYYARRANELAGQAL